MYEVVSVIIIVFGVLQIILFFKVWAMTTDVKNILDVLNAKDNREVKLPKTATLKGVDGEVEIVGLKNGKILCRRKYGNYWNEEEHDINELSFE